MRSLCIILLVALSCLVLAEAQQCPRFCHRVFRPVCATWIRRGVTEACTFPNECVLKNQICQRNQNWKLQTREACRRESRDCIVLRQ